MSTGEGIMWAAAIVVGLPILFWVVGVLIALVVVLILDARTARLHKQAIKRRQAFNNRRNR